MQLLAAAQLPAQDSPTHGITVEAIYTGDVIGVAGGGIRRDAVYLDNLDLKLHLEGARLLHWPGALGFIYVLSNRGDSPETIVGDAQGVSNIAAPRGWRLYEAWLQQNLARGRLSLLAGLYDVNTEFDVIESAGLFLNGSFGMGAEYGNSGRNGPSIFPVTSLGFRAKYKPHPSFYLEAIVADGVPGDTARPGSTRVSLGHGDGALLAAEVAVLAGAAERRRAPPSAPNRSRIGSRRAIAAGAPAGGSPRCATMERWRSAAGSTPDGSRTSPPSPVQAPPPRLRTATAFMY